MTQRENRIDTWCSMLHAEVDQQIDRSDDRRQRHNDDQRQYSHRHHPWPDHKDNAREDAEELAAADGAGWRRHVVERAGWTKV